MQCNAWWPDQRWGGVGLGWVVAWGTGFTANLREYASKLIGRDRFQNCNGTTRDQGSVASQRALCFYASFQFIYLWCRSAVDGNQRSRYGFGNASLVALQSPSISSFLPKACRATQIVIYLIIPFLPSNFSRPSNFYFFPCIDFHPFLPLFSASLETLFF